MNDVRSCLCSILSYKYPVLFAPMNDNRFFLFSQNRIKHDPKFLKTGSGAKLS